MKLIKTIVLILAMNFCVALSANALPSIYTVVLDASGSISQTDFRQENKAAGVLVQVIHAASQTKKNEGKLADFISVAWFGGRNEYNQYPYFNVSNETKVNTLVNGLESVHHPKYGNTAIYSALANATVTALKKEESLRSNYNQVIVLVTDGQDNQSPYNTRELIKKLYPNRAIFLAVVGVGPEARVDEFRRIADDVRHIDNFAELAAVFTVYSGLFR